jgi:hypothetical protein
MVAKGINRRTFLRLLVGAVAAGYAGTGMSAAQSLMPWTAGVSLNGPLNYELFAALVGDTFTLSMLDPKNKYSAQLQLVEANPVFLSSENDQFYLVFQVDDSNTALNGTYRIKHATAGKMQIFLLPMGDDMGGNYCRADFNLLL